MFVDIGRKHRFKERFEKNYTFLCKIALGYIDNRDECEDIVQETFISVWNNNKDVLPEKDFTAYMVRAVQNNCISFLRKKRPQFVSIENGQYFPDSDNDEDNSENRICMEDMKSEILSILPPKCREVFLMSKLNGMKYKEIAIEMNISDKTVENHMGKAIKIIRKYVSEHKFIIILLISIL